MLVLAAVVLTRDTPDWRGNWVWPVPTWVESGVAHFAVISQEWRSPDHLGVDILYRVGGQWTAPEDTPIIAAREGVVWSVDETARGHSVVIDHGAPWATFYQHLSSVAVAKGQQVAAGDTLGIMGSDPTDAAHVRHLHFATWYKGAGDVASVDPARAMVSWRRVTWTG